MSEPRKNHLIIDGGQVKEDEHVASYKPIPESDTACEIEYLDADTEFVLTSQKEMDSQDDSDDHWDPKSTANMLSLYLENIDKFRNPKMRKKNVWVEIGNAIGKGPDSCDKKFRNLKLTYIRLLKKKNKSGVTTFKWPFFDIFEEIYSVDGKYQSEIQQKISVESSDRIKELINSTTKLEDSKENGETSNGQTAESKRRLLRKRNAEFRKVTIEMRDRQRCVEEKLDRLIQTVEESNNIQRERNRLFQEFLNNLTPNH